MSARIAHEQALYSSGDRRIDKVIEAAARMKGNLNSALRETGVDAAFHTSRDRSYEEFLPWSIVDSGLSFEFLREEHEKAQAAKSTAPCPSTDTCVKCGVCPSTWLGSAEPAFIQLQRLRPNVQALLS
jgi:hypothetical protein